MFYKAIIYLEFLLHSLHQEFFWPSLKSKNQPEFGLLKLVKNFQ